MKERAREIVLLFVISIALPCILGLIFAAIPTKGDASYWSRWWLCSQVMYLWFCAGFTAGGVLMLITPFKGDHAIGFGCGLYYGTIFTGSILRDNMSDEDAFFIGFIIAALVCYIVWLRSFKSQYKKDDGK